MVIISCVPSFYPIYKSLIAPHLPSPLRQFFSYLKSLFLTFCSFFLSGTLSKSPVTPDSLSTLFSNHTLSNSTQLSLQDWIFLYIQRCDVFHGVHPLQDLCASCSCPSWVEAWRRADAVDTCSVCDYCLQDSEHAEGTIGFWVNEHCRDIINDMAPIVDAGKSLAESASLAAVLADCCATFLLYIRFFLHLSYRFLLRSSRNFSVVLHYLYVFVEWAVLEIRANAASNPLLAVAMTFALVIFFFAVLSLLRNLLSLVRVVVGSTPPASPSRAWHARRGRQGRAEEGRRALRLAARGRGPPQALFTRAGEGVSPTSRLAARRGALRAVGEPVGCPGPPRSRRVAKLLRLCSGEGEELDWLGRLLEQLFNGGRAASQ